MGRGGAAFRWAVAGTRLGKLVPVMGTPRRMLCRGTAVRPELPRALRRAAASPAGRTGGPAHGAPEPASGRHARAELVQPSVWSVPATAGCLPAVAEDSRTLAGP